MSKMENMKVLVITDDDLTSTGLPGLGYLKGSSSLAWQADLIIHETTGEIYKSRWTALPTRVCDKHCWVDSGMYSRNAMVGALREGMEACKHCDAKRKKIEQPQWRYEDV